MPDGVWTSRTDMPLPAREYPGGSNIGEEEGYVCYGYDNITNDEIRDTDEYNRVGDFWSNKAEAPVPARMDFRAVTIGDDKMYAFAGGTSPDQSGTDDNDEYSKAGDSWTNKTDVTGYDRTGPSAFGIGTDTAYVCSGGRSGPVQTMQDCREYSQSGDSWSTKADHPTPTRRCSAGFGIGGNGYIAGGTTSANDTTNGIQDLDRYTPSGDVWLSMSDLPDPTRKSPGGCTMLLSGYVQGGKDYIQDCDEYDSTENQWSNKTDMPAPGRTGATSIALGDNDCYCMGGKSDYNTSIADCDEFHMPAVPWIENLSPSNGQIDVPVDANIEFDVKDDTGVDQNTITVKVGDDFAIVNGVFQAGFTGTITAI